MTMTVSDLVSAAEPAAAVGGSAPVDDDSARRASALAHDAPANARARVLATQSVVKRVAEDLTGAWVWHETPPSLRQVISDRFPDAGRVPAEHGPLRAVWVVWNFGVAVPATATLYALAWVLQHPARAGVLALVVGPLGIFWITNK
jgi:hypothetical protein